VAVTSPFAKGKFEFNLVAGKVRLT
jgi:hypothetical protein